MKLIYKFILLLVTINSTLIAQPANDDCANATIINVVPNTNVCLSGTNINATPGMPYNQQAAACNPSGNQPNPSNDVWFAFQAAGTSATVTLSNSTFTGVNVAIYQSSSTPDCAVLGAFGCYNGTNTLTIPLAGLRSNRYYFIQVSGSSITDNSTFDLCVNLSNAPAGDDPCTAPPIPGSSVCNYITGTNASATTTTGVPAPGCANYQGTDVWYTYTVPAAGSQGVEFNTDLVTGSAITDGGLAVYSGLSCSNLSLVDCDDDSNPNNAMSQIIINNPAAGTTYWIRVWEYGGDATGEFNICVVDYGPPPPPPSYDDPCTALNLTVNSNCINTQVTIAGATATSGVPNPTCGNYVGGDVWMTFTVPNPVGNIEIQTSTIIGNAFTDAGMAIYTGNCSTLTQTFCSSGGMPQTLLSSPTPGTQYWIRVWENGNDITNGQFNICIANVPAPPNGDAPCYTLNTGTLSGSQDTTICVIPGTCANITLRAIPQLDSKETDIYDMQQINMPNPAYSQLGTNIIVDDDDIWSDVVPIGFPFCYFGQVYNNVVIGSNAVVTFNAAAATQRCEWSYTGGIPYAANAGDPTDERPWNSIYAGYSDVDPSVGFDANRINYHYEGVYPCRRLVITFSRIPNFSCNAQLFTSQIVLHEAYNIVDVIVTDRPACTNWNGGRAIIGIQGNTGTLAYAPLNHNPSTVSYNNVAYRFTPNGNVTLPTIDWYNGTTLVASDTNQITVCVDSTSRYTAIAHNSLCNGSVVEISEDVNITMGTPPLAEIKPVIIDCNASNVNLDASTSSFSSNGVITWNGPIGGINSGANTLTPNVGITGTYSIILTEPGGCADTASVDIDFGQVTVDAGQDITICTNSVDTLGGNPTVGNGVTLTWTSIPAVLPAGISISSTSINNPEITIGNGVSPQTISFIATGECSGQFGRDTINVTITNPIADAGLNVNVCDNNTINIGTIGNNGITYSWSPTTYLNGTENQAIATVSPPLGTTNQTITYTLTATLGNCTSTDNVDVNINQCCTPFSIIPTVINNTIACTPCNGSIGLAVNTTNPNVTYAWSHDALNNTSSAANLCAGNYTVTVSSSIPNCDTILNFSINGPQSLTIDSINTTDVTCLSGGTLVVYANYGTPPYQYNIGTGNQASNTFNNLPQNVYTVTVTDFNNCSAVSTVVINPAPAAIQIQLNKTDVKCSGEGNGTIEAIPSGGTPNYIFTWEDNSSNPIRNNLTAGNYAVTVTDIIGCTAVSTITVNEPSLLTSSAQVNTNFNGFGVACFGDNNGVASVIANGGTPNMSGNYSYLWSWNNETNSSISNLPAGNYSVTVTDSNNCSSVNNINVSSPTEIIIDSVHITPVTCISNGDLNIYAHGGNGILQYSIDGVNFQNSSIFNPLPPNNYTITIRDINNCSKNINITQNPPAPPIQIQLNKTDVKCNGEDNGTIEAIPSGGTPNYTFTWEDNSLNPIRNNLTAGNYAVTVTDIIGCTAIGTITVNEPSLLTSSAQVNTNFNGFGVACFGDNNGAASVIANGGTPNMSGNYSYLWSWNNETNSSISNLPAGNYSVTVTDSNNCSSVNNINVSSPTEIIIDSVHITPVTCISNGDLNIYAHGGNGILQYSIDGVNFQNSSIFNPLPPNNYTITIRDINNCSKNIDVNQPNQASALIASINGNNVKCNSNNDGNANVSITGGYPPYIISWSNGSTIDSIQNLSPGRYYVTVNDQGGCVSIDSIDISEPGQLIVELSPTYPSCFSSSDGSISSNLLGGISPFNYSWTDAFGNPIGSNSPTLNSLVSGVYFLNVNDNNNCFATNSVTLIAPDSISLRFELTEPLCFGSSDGSIEVQPSGGTLPYISYSWSNGQNTSIANNLPLGTYYVTVTDNNNCTAIASSILNQPDSLHVSTQFTNSTCWESNNGTASIQNVFGGTAPYNYTWSNGLGNNAFVNNLQAGIYTVTIYDFQNCNTTRQFEISRPDSITVDFTLRDINCFQDSTGNINAGVNGGISPYRYSWNTGNTNDTLNFLNNIPKGEYIVTITDANNCIRIDKDTLVELSNSSVFARDSIVNALCFGYNDGEIHVLPQGGKPPYNYALNGFNNQSNNAFIGLEADTYQISVTDSLGCRYIFESIVGEPLEIIVYAGSDDTIRLGEQKLLKALLVQGPDSVSYSWSPNVDILCDTCITTIASPFVTRTYTVAVVDTNGCRASDQVTIFLDIERPVFIPNAFTPNNDGNNDRITVFASPIVKQVRQFSIYDRWGEKVFESKNFPPSNENYGWDGSFKGKSCNPQIFVYYTEVEFIDGELMQFKGEINLIR
jgi:gliding motility-associated-like protein